MPFMIKKSVYEKIQKSLEKKADDFAKLKAEVLSILKKQAKEEIKDQGQDVQKSGYPVGTVRIWKGQQYIKVAPNKWKPKYNSESRGAKNSLTRLIHQVENCKDINELMKIVMENKDRFTDANGNHLPIVDKLRAAADKKNDEITNGTSSTKPMSVDQVKKIHDKIEENKKKGKKISPYEAQKQIDDEELDKKVKQVQEAAKKKDVSKMTREEILAEMSKQVKLKEKMDKPYYETLKNEINKINEVAKKENERRLMRNNADDFSLSKVGKKVDGEYPRFDDDGIKLLAKRIIEKYGTTDEARKKLSDLGDFNSTNDSTIANVLTGANTWDYIKDKIGMKSEEKKDEPYFSKETHNIYVGRSISESSLDDIKRYYEGEKKLVKQFEEQGDTRTAKIHKEYVEDKEREIKLKTIMDNPDKASKEELNDTIMELEEILSDAKKDIEKTGGSYASKLTKKTLSKTIKELQKKLSEKVKEPEESEAEKHQNRSDAMKGNQNAYKGGPKEEPKEEKAPKNETEEKVNAVHAAVDEYIKKYSAGGEYEHSADWAAESTAKRYGKKKLEELANMKLKKGEEYTNWLKGRVKELVEKGDNITPDSVSSAVYQHFYMVKMQEFAQKKLGSMNENENSIDLPVQEADMDEAKNVIAADVKRILEGRDTFGNAKQTLVDKIRRRVRNSPGVARAMLVYIKQEQEKYGKKVFTDKHSIWEELPKLNENARQAAEKGESETKGGVTGTLYESEDGGISVVEDKDWGRYKISFPGKPDAETISTLKHNGFRWSPSTKTWVGYNTANGEYSLKRVAEKLGLKKPTAKEPESEGVR